MMRRFLQYILKILAKVVLWRYKPEVVAITGSVGKTGTKEAIALVLQKYFRVWRNQGNYNNEIGVPLTILGIESAGRSVFSWLIRFFQALKTIVWKIDYPEILILEMGVDKPGDMKYLTGFIPVDAAVITAIGEFPSHLEFFPEKDGLVKEKALLAKAVNKDGAVVLNYDDLSVRMIGDDLSEGVKLIRYGFGGGANLQISNFSFYAVDLSKGDFGINFKLEYEGSIVPFRLEKGMGKQQAFAAAAAAAAGIYFNLNLVEISGALKEYSPLPGRTNLIKGVKGSWLIDDSYNASPLAVIAALEILEGLVNELKDLKLRKIAVLGDMLELGEKTEIGHRRVGERAAKTVDLLFTVGERARFIADEAEKQGLDKDKIFEFSRPEQAALKLQEEVTSQDIVLVKGSRGIHLEEVVREVMAEPEKAEKLLVNK